MDKLVKTLAEIKDRKFKITTTTKGVEQLQQTERNALKAELVNALFADLKAAHDFTYRVKDGIMLEIENGSIADGIANELGSGAITITLDIKVNDLETNAETASEDYRIDVEEKAEKKAAAAKKKADKIARDTAERKAKKGA